MMSMIVDTDLYFQRNTVKRLLDGKKNPKIYAIYHYFFGTYEV